MRPSSQLSRGAGLLLLVSGLIAAGAWSAHARWRPVIPPPEPELTSLAGEAERLRGNTDAERDTWRKRRANLGHNAWTRSSLEAFEAGAPEWRWQWTAVDQATLHRVSPLIVEWPGYVAFVDSLGRKPGVAIETIEVSATGAGRDRRFAEVRLGLRFILAGAVVGDGTRAGPSPVPAPVALAEVPDPTRKVGTGPALRPASAFSRPDPPGPRTGVQTTITPIKTTSP